MNAQDCCDVAIAIYVQDIVAVLSLYEYHGSNMYLPKNLSILINLLSVLSKIILVNYTCNIVLVIENFADQIKNSK